MNQAQRDIQRKLRVFNHAKKNREHKDSMSLFWKFMAYFLPLEKRL